MKYLEVSKYLFFLIVVILFLSGCETKKPCEICKSSGKIECKTCRGDKKYTSNIDCKYCSNGYSTCSECDGEGTAKCRYCYGEEFLMKPCYACGGSGMHFYPSGYSVPCNVCGGAAMKYEPCFKCDGDGKIECEECGGDGTVRCSYCSGSGYESNEVNCNICDENGKINCNKCSGKGYTIE
ncbi:MAG TPA: hypothetical protein VIK14_05465 [Ignavibacteria bacterium]